MGLRWVGTVKEFSTMSAPASNNPVRGSVPSQRDLWFSSLALPAAVSRHGDAGGSDGDSFVKFLCGHSSGRFTQEHGGVN